MHRENNTARQQRILCHFHKAWYNLIGLDALQSRPYLLEQKSCTCLLLPSKHKTFLDHLYNVVLTSKTLGWRCINAIQMFCVYCVDINICVDTIRGNIIKYWSYVFTQFFKSNITSETNIAGSIIPLVARGVIKNITFTKLYIEKNSQTWIIIWIHSFQEIVLPDSLAD